MEIGFKIKKIRELRNYSQEHMAEKLGISQVSYSRVESGQTKMDLKRLHDIAKVLEIDPVFLLTFDDSFIFNNCNQCGKTVHNYNAASEEEKQKFDLKIQQLEYEINKLKGN